MLRLWLLLVAAVVGVCVTGNGWSWKAKTTVEAKEVPLGFEDERVDLFEGLLRVCSELCDDQLKDNDVCQDFCRFVEHIEAEHAEEIQTTFETYGRKLAPASWAMQDTIRWRLQTNQEDLHALGDYFLESLLQWSRFAFRHDEL
ncbi:hypothetical protein QOT17_019661 [Balamuthia mandrillaris]